MTTKHRRGSGADCAWCYNADYYYFSQHRKPLTSQSWLSATRAVFTARCYDSAVLLWQVVRSSVWCNVGHIGWNTSKIILSRLISLRSALSADPTHCRGSVPKGTTQILAGMGMGCGKSGSWRRKFAISLKRLKIERIRKLLLTAYVIMKS